MPLQRSHAGPVLGAVMLLVTTQGCAGPAVVPDGPPTAPEAVRSAAFETPAAGVAGAPGLGAPVVVGSLARTDQAPVVVRASYPDDSALAPATLLPVPGQTGGPEKDQDGLGTVKFADTSSAAPDDVWQRLDRDYELSLDDYRRYYGGEIGYVLAGIVLAAPLANTSADQHISNWYQKNVRAETTNEFATVIGYAGQAWVIFPVGVEAAALLGKTDENYAFDSGLYEWSNRSLRSFAVGFPPVVALYGVLGASRPDRKNSHWHPFQDIHGVSGHTFVGAVPFLTAAEMTDNLWIQAPLVAGSFLTGWSRINDDRHYFSQVALGWWMAYLAVRTVDQTQQSRRSSLSVVPYSSEGPGFGIQVKY